MFPRIVSLCTLAAALGSGLVAGIFFAFSTFVMSALARISPAEGIAAMNSINVTVINRWFMTAFLGTAALDVCLAIYALFHRTATNSLLLLGAAALYLVGNIVVTGAFNVPLNDSLATMDPKALESAAFWTNRYLPEWNLWNHVRTATAFAASALQIVVLMRGRA